MNEDDVTAVEICAMHPRDYEPGPDPYACGPQAVAEVLTPKEESDAIMREIAEDTRKASDRTHARFLMIQGGLDPFAGPRAFADPATELKAKAERFSDAFRIGKMAHIRDCLGFLALESERTPLRERMEERLKYELRILEMMGK